MSHRVRRTVGIKDLKNNLSAWLREVRRGTHVLVTDRDRIVAELHEPGAGYRVDSGLDPLVERWIEQRAVRPPERDKRPLPRSPTSLPDGSATRLLEEDRGESA